MGAICTKHFSLFQEKTVSSPSKALLKAGVWLKFTVFTLCHSTFPSKFTMENSVKLKILAFLSRKSSSSDSSISKYVRESDTASMPSEILYNRCSISSVTCKETSSIYFFVCLSITFSNSAVLSISIIIMMTVASTSKIVRNFMLLIIFPTSVFIRASLPFSHSLPIY